jgi:triphosphoribosyl-dephospho-CoA synthase
MIERADYVAEKAVMAAVLEASAPKPGNVSPSHSHGKAKYVHFVASASALGPIMKKIASGDFALGQGMFHAVNRSLSVQRGGNVHLGVILLFGPIASAAGSAESLELSSLRRELNEVLRDASYEDAVYTYNAMKHADASGIPESALKEDSLKEIIDRKLPLLEWMEKGAEHSAVAKEYSTSYERSFEVALPAMKSMYEKSGILTGIVHSYIVMLSKYPDTHIAAIHGNETAKGLRDFVAETLKGGGTPEKLELIREYIEEKEYNPGATADIVASALFIGLLSGELSL